MPRSPKPDLDVVLGVLGDAENYPVEGHTPASRATLISGFPLAIPRLPRAETHKFQKGLVASVDALLTGARQAAAAALEGLSGEVREAEERFACAQVSVSEAAQATAAKREEREAKSAALREKEAETAAADAYFAPLEEVKVKAQKTRTEMEGQKKATEAAIAALEDFEKGQREQSPVEMVMKQLSRLQAEQALRLAAPHALPLKPAERRWFDDATMAEVRSVLAQAATAVAEHVVARAEEEADAAAEALGAWAVLDVAREHEGDARFELDVAKRHVRNAEAAEEAAKAAMDERRVAMSDALVQHTLMEEKLKELDAALAALSRCTCLAADAQLQQRPAQQSESKDVEMHPGQGDKFASSDIPGDEGMAAAEDAARADQELGFSGAKEGILLPTATVCDFANVGA